MLLGKKYKWQNGLIWLISNNKKFLKTIGVKKRDNNICTSMWLINNKCKLSIDVKYIKFIHINANISLQLARIYR